MRGVILQQILHADSFHFLVEVLRVFEKMVPPPRKVPFSGSFLMRYEERLPKQALVQKLAHCLSVLRSCDILISSGQVQAVGALQRVLDDANQDVLFLSLGLAEEGWTSKHDKFISEFFAEDGYQGEALGLPASKVSRLSRRQIRAYVANSNPGGNPSRETETSAKLFSVLSGFVHGSSPNIMDYYDPTLPGFRVSEITGTDRHRDYLRANFNYHFRTFCSFMIALSVFDLKRDRTGDELLRRYDICAEHLQKMDVRESLAFLTRKS